MKISRLFYPKMKGGIFVEEKTTCFVERIGGVTFIVNVHSAKDAKIHQEEFIKRLIIKESMAIKDDDA